MDVLSWVSIFFSEQIEADILQIKYIATVQNFPEEVGAVARIVFS